MARTLSSNQRGLTQRRGRGSLCSATRSCWSVTVFPSTSCALDADYSLPSVPRVLESAGLVLRKWQRLDRAHAPQAWPENHSTYERNAAALLVTCNTSKCDWVEPQACLCLNAGKAQDPTHPLQDPCSGAFRPLRGLTPVKFTREVQWTRSTPDNQNRLTH